MRENTEYIRPPRALWVPFDLGRPLGAPNEPGFQRDVLRATLALFEHKGGPVILEDFPTDAPGQGDPANMEGLVCPVPLRKPLRTASPDALVQAVELEITKLAPWAELFRTQNQRTTVTVAKKPLSESLQLIRSLVRSEDPADIPKPDWPKAVRHAIEDLRNYYTEAVNMRPGGPATHQEQSDWFWKETNAGKLLLELAQICAKHDHQPLREVPIVPRAQKHRKS